MKRFLLIFALILIISLLSIINNLPKALKEIFRIKKIEHIKTAYRPDLIEQGLSMLRKRNDLDALGIFEAALSENPLNIDALWGKAEILRRQRKYNESEQILNEVIKINPSHVSSLITLAYIRYHENKLSLAMELIKKAINSKGIDSENEAMAYVMLGTINARLASDNSLLNRLKYSTKIKPAFIKAIRLSPNLPEAHLALGTFYLLAPSMIGGNINKALVELQYSVKITPNFATANARLSQAFKKIGDEEKSKFYLEKAEALDPNAEVMENEQY